MKNFVSSLFLVAICFNAQAQWAVYDKSVHDELIKVNSVQSLQGKSFTELEKTYNSQLNTDASKPQDLTLGEGDNKAVIKGIDTKFETLTDLTPEDKAKYIGTMEDCGSQKASPQVYNSCLGLRNLRIQTLKSTQQGLRNLFERKKQVLALLIGARGIGENDKASGLMQRYHFELQGLQALMQADTEMVKMVMLGYKDREKLYEIQQAEAQRDMLARGARMDKHGNKITSKPLPFFSPMKSLYEPKNN